MEVKIMNTVYDSEETPIMIILSPSEKELISSMKNAECEAKLKFLSYPDDMTPEEAIEFMKTE